MAHNYAIDTVTTAYTTEIHTQTMHFHLFLHSSVSYSVFLLGAGYLSRSIAVAHFAYVLFFTPRYRLTEINGVYIYMNVIYD